MKVGHCYKTQSSSWPVLLKYNGQLADLPLKADTPFLVLEILNTERDYDYQINDYQVNQFCIFYDNTEYILRIHDGFLHAFEFVI